VQFKAVATLSNGKQQDVTKSVVWDSTKTTVATISNAPGSEGLATSVGAGEALIIATLSTVQGQAKLTVKLATLQSLEINVDSASINRGETYPFHVQGTYWDGSKDSYGNPVLITYDITDQVAWTSSDTAVAEISNAPGSRGVATGISNGTVTITASRDGKTDTATLTVTSDTTPPRLMKAELLPGDRVRVIYNEDMDITRATNYANYIIIDGTSENYTFEDLTQTTDFGFKTDTPIIVESLRSFILRLDQSTQQKIYTLVANDAEVRDVAGNTLEFHMNHYSFAGLDTVKPYMLNAINTGQYITIKFSEPMKTGSGDTQSADFKGSYTLTLEPSGGAGRTIESVTEIDPQTFKITLDGEVTSNTQYRVTVNSNVRDASSNANTMGTPRYLSFTGNETLKVVSAEEIEMGTVIITFNKPVLASTANADDATCEKRYKISPYAGNLLSATVGSGEHNNTVTLTYEADTTRFATAYTVIVANGRDGDNFNNVQDDEKIYAYPYNANDYVQAQPKDRATFQGLGQIINNFEDGTFFADPFVDGTSFAFAFAYGGKIYLGTNDLNNAAFRFDPSGMNSVLTTFAASQHPASLNYCADATGFGYGLGDVCGTNMGFHGERGVVGFTSATLNITGTNREILLVGPLKDGVTYGYFTQDLDTELDWIPFTFGVTGGNNTKSIQCLYGFKNHVYLGFSSPHGQQAPIASHHTVTEDGSGNLSIEHGTDMNIKSVAYIGKKGSPANIAADYTNSVVGIDSMIYFDATNDATDNGMLYMANNGGIMGSSDYSGFTAPFLATPGGFTGTTLQLPAAPAGLEKISSGQKGIPILHAYNGKLYMVRNVAENATTGRQTALRGEVWVCDPSTNDPNKCEPGEWTRIISGTESELGTAPSSISMFTTNGSGVFYVGFDDTTNGVKIFRYAGTGPSATVTTMLSAGWVPQGQAGLGGSYEKILSSASISDGVYNYIYVTVGKGTEAIRVFRQID
jgi:hypothetical protein